ncbi:MAG: 50S ribosomal protein L3 [Chloroflexi bacterium]|nr:50S ribosomal protein L3 [Chloroflexota bacterium]
MSIGLIGKKIGMTQVFDSEGAAVPVTAVQAGPCTVVQVKTAAGADGYSAVQIGFGERLKKISRPARGHVEKHLGDDASVPRDLHEFRVADPSAYEAGQTLDVELFAEGQTVDVSGVSKGKGFAGVMRRHNFSGQQKTHGQSDRWRAPGAVGMGTTPGRVWKGQKMAGRMGQDLVTVQNLEVIRIVADQDILLIKGAIPGGPGSLVTVRPAVKSPGTPQASE